ncbi:MAG: glycosyltransferase involved in cell wall biosynthesis [Desulforhopalus sp.]|jgi:glycosyltransferase involved in cell wall biosynthesis
MWKNKAVITRVPEQRTNKKPRLLFMTSVPFFQWRGSSIRVAFNVQALADLGYEIDLLTIPIGETKNIPGVTVHRVSNPFRVKNIPIGPSVHKLIFDILILFKALAMVVRQRYVAVHAVEEVGVIGLLIGRLTGSRVIFEKHSDPASHKDKPFKNIVLSLYRWLEGIVIRKVDIVIGTGEGLVEQAMAVAPKQKVHHIFDIPSSCQEADPEQVQLLKVIFRRKPDEIIALYVGSFAVYQGIDLMFESLLLALKESPNLRLVVIGGTQDQIDIRNEWLDQRGIREMVRFVGFVTPDRLPDYISAADFLLSPRISGINTPLKLLDYLKSGKAILATDNVANRRIVDEKVAVLKQANSKSFATGMVELTRNSHFRHGLGVEGRKLIDKIYNYGQFKIKLKACYDKL